MTTEWKDITDPKELFRLKRDGWEIEYFPPTYPSEWMLWEGKVWELNNIYRARPRQPKTKKVKLLAWIDRHGELRRVRDDAHWVNASEWIRQPHLDREGEVPE